MGNVIDFGDAEFRASAGVVFHVIDWLADHLPSGDPLRAELTATEDTNAARLDLHDARCRPLVNLLADRLPAHTRSLAGSTPELARQLHQLATTARRHRRHQLQIRTGDTRSRYRSLPRTPDPWDTQCDVDTHLSEVEHGLVADYNEGALPYLRILGWRP